MDDSNDWHDAIEVEADCHEDAADKDPGLMANLEETATDCASTAQVLVSAHKDGRDSKRFELSVRVTWSYGVDQLD